MGWARLCMSDDYRAFLGGKSWAFFQVNFDKFRIPPLTSVRSAFCVAPLGLLVGIIWVSSRGKRSLCLIWKWMDFHEAILLSSCLLPWGKLGAFACFDFGIILFYLHPIFNDDNLAECLWIVVGRNLNGVPIEGSALDLHLSVELKGQNGAKIASDQWTGKGQIKMWLTVANFLLLINWGLRNTNDDYRWVLNPY
jgi:hypothetical protein